MRKLIYTAALLVMGITASYAQQQERAKLTAEQKAEKAAGLMQQKLALSADQTQKIKQIELERIKKNEEWRKQNQAAIKGQLEQRKAFAKANQDRIDAILTPAQKKTLDANRAEMRSKFKDRKRDGEHKGRKGPKRNGNRPPAPTEKN